MVRDADRFQARVYFNLMTYHDAVIMEHSSGFTTRVAYSVISNKLLVQVPYDSSLETVRPEVVSLLSLGHYSLGL